MSSGLARFLTRALSQMLPQLAVFALLLVVLAPQSSVYWACEGQPCGPTAWACCCAQPNDTQDTECGEANNHFTRGDHVSEVGDCAVDCHCSVVVQPGSPSLSSATYSFASPLLFVVPATFAPVLETPIFTETAHPQPSRGPPPPKVHLASAPLRGPPVA